MEMSKLIVKAVAEAMRITIQAMVERLLRMAENQQGSKIGCPLLKQPQFNWDVADKYSEWKAFILKVKNVLSTYNTPEHDKIAIVKNWLGRKGLYYIQSITEAEKLACNILQGLFDTLSTKFWLQFNETIKLLQFRKLCRSEDKNAEEWMGWLHMAAAECGYKEIDRQLKEQFIHGLNNKIMLDKITRELTSEDVLAWAKRVKSQRVQASMLNDITETKAFNKVKKGNRVKEYPRKRSACCNTPQMDVQVLWGKPHIKTMPSIWENVCSMQQDGTLQEGVQEQKKLCGS